MPIKAFKLLDLSPVNIIPTKQNKITRNPNIFKNFFDLKKFRIYPKIIKENPQINDPAIGSFLKKTYNSLSMRLANSINLYFSKTKNIASSKSLNVDIY